jgi:GTPase KRas protein
MLVGHLPFTDPRALFDYVVRGSHLSMESYLPGDCSQFVQKLMAASPRQRPTAKDALKHGWVEAGMTDPVSSTDYPPPAEAKGKEHTILQPLRDDVVGIEASAQWTVISDTTALEPIEQRMAAIRIIDPKKTEHSSRGASGASSSTKVAPSNVATLPRLSPGRSVGSGAPPYQELKIAVLGPCGVGKSSLVFRLVFDLFSDIHDPTFEDSYRKIFLVDGKPVLLNILDTAGEGGYSVSRKGYLNEAHGYLLVYSITSRESFTDGIKASLREITAARSDKGSRQSGMTIVGNKSDLATGRWVSKEEGWDWANQLYCGFFETSALERVNVEEAFYSLVRQLRARGLTTA